MKTVDQILREKGPGFWSVAPDMAVYTALELMAQKNVGALPVMDGEHLAGIFSERDYARKVVLEGKSSKETPVRQIMTAKVVCAKLGQSIEECMALMTDKHCRHLPVIDENKVVGVISIGDVVKALLSEQTFVISQLEHYISGSI